MPCRKLAWIAMAVAAVAFVPASPLPGLCRDGLTCSTSQAAPAGAAMGKTIGVRTMLTARSASKLNPNGRPPLAYAFTRALEDDLAVSANFLKNGQTRDLGLESSGVGYSCQSLTQIAMGFDKTPATAPAGLISLAAVCDGAIAGVEGYYDWETDSVNWSKMALENAEGMNDVSVAVRLADDNTLYQSVCATDNATVWCWDPGAATNGVVTPTEYKLPEGEQFTHMVSHTYDSQGQVHMAGVREDGSLGYAQSPDLSGVNAVISWLGSPAMGWHWVQVSEFRGRIHVWAYNWREGNTYLWWKDPGPNQSWHQDIIKGDEESNNSTGMFNSMADNSVGMYGSMAVDDETGLTTMTYANSAGYAVTATVIPGEAVEAVAQDTSHGEPYSTATAAGGGYVDNMWASESGIWHQECQMQQ